MADQLLPGFSFSTVTFFAESVVVGCYTEGFVDGTPFDVTGGAVGVVWRIDNELGLVDGCAVVTLGGAPLSACRPIAMPYGVM